MTMIRHITTQHSLLFPQAWLVRLLWLVIVAACPCWSYWNLRPALHPLHCHRHYLHPWYPFTRRWASSDTPSSLPSTEVPRGGGSDEEDGTSTFDAEFAGQTSALFGNVRIPAALFAGASAGGAFALPVTSGATDSVKIGLAKRIYALLMIHSLAAQVVTILVATIAMTGIATRSSIRLSTNTYLLTTTATATLRDWIYQHYHAAWTTVHYQFLTGVLSFGIAMGVRTWLTTACTVLAGTCIGLLVSSSLLALAFYQDLGQTALWRLPWEQMQVLFGLSRRRGGGRLFLLAILSYTATLAFVVWRMPHLIQYLVAVAATSTTS